MATTTGCSFGGADLIIPDSDDDRFDYALRAGANSYLCPVGPEPGRGWIVMEREALEGMDPTTPKTLTWKGNIAKDKRISDRLGSGAKFELKNLYVVNDPIRIDTTGDGAPGSLYLVEITDVRYLAKHFSSINKSYNLRKPGSTQGDVGGTEDRYYTTTLDAGAFWTWDSLCGDIWTSTELADLLGAYPGLPYTPEGTPEDMRFVGMTAWGALHAVLDQIGCTTAIDPTADDSPFFSIVRLGQTQTDLTAKENAYDTICPRLHSFNAQEAIATRIPETIRVHFQYRDETSPANWLNLAYTIDVPTDVVGVVSGTVLPIWDSLPARYDAAAAGLSNLAAINTRAAEVKDNWLAIHDVQKGRKVYGEIIADILPGEEVRAVEWRNSGDSWRTTVLKRPDVCVDLWPKKFAEPMRLERLASEEDFIFAELAADLTAGGSALAFLLIFGGGIWTATTSQVTVYDSIGDKVASTGAWLIAKHFWESQRYEIVQVLC